jgi:hypothetical protein
MINPPTPDLAAQIPNKKPVWKISPAGGKYYINSVAVSADGGRVVGGTFYHAYPKTESRRGPALLPVAGETPSPDDGTFGVYCYSGSGQPLWNDEFAGWQGVYWVALSADGSRAAAGGLMSASGPHGFVRAYDAANQGRLLLSQPTQQRVNQVALSGDGTWLVSAAETLLLFRYDPTSRAYRQSDEFLPDKQDGIVSTAISADGLTVAYADYDGNIGVFANTAGKLILRARWKVPGGTKADFCHMIDLAPDGKAFAAGGAGGQFYFFEVAKFIAKPEPTIVYSTGMKGAVYGVAGAPDGSMFAGVVNNGDAGQVFPVPIVNGTAAPVQPLALKRNPNSADIKVTAGVIRLAVADGHPDGTPGHYYLFSCPAGAGQPLLRLRWIFETGNMSWPIAIAANGGAVVGGSDDSHLYYFTP